MKLSLVLLLFVSTIPALHGVEKPFSTGRIISIEPKMHTKVLYYLVNTPVTQDDPYYEVSIQLKDMVYVAEYEPRHAADGLPDDFKADAAVQARVEKRHLYVKRPSGLEMDLIIVGKTAASPAEKTPPADPAKH